MPPYIAILAIFNQGVNPIFFYLYHFCIIQFVLVAFLCNIAKFRLVWLHACLVVCLFSHVCLYACLLTFACLVRRLLARLFTWFLLFFNFIGVCSFPFFLVDKSPCELLGLFVHVCLCGCSFARLLTWFLLFFNFLGVCSYPCLVFAHFLFFLSTSLHVSFLACLLVFLRWVSCGGDRGKAAW